MIPASVQIKNKELPEQPGVYFYFDASGKLLYIGKATSLKARVGSYFVGAHNARLSELVSKIARIDYIVTESVIQALVLEANQIRVHRPPYNVMLKDDKSFLYLVITNEDFPKPLLMRGLDLERLGVEPFAKEMSVATKKKFLAIFGPYTSSRSLKKALDLIRPTIPWSVCESPIAGKRIRACFDRQIRKCPGVCTGEITKQEYRHIIKRLMLFFEGKQDRIVRELEREMRVAVRHKQFEEAAKFRDRLFAFQHIRDVALLSREDYELPLEKTEEGYLDLSGRIEAYDISNISGTASVASMVVFEDGRPAKHLYRKFRIKTVEGPNDFASMEEVLRRRLIRSQTSPRTWPLPIIMIIDGGEGQMEKVRQVMEELNVEVPMIGIAKGFDRKQDRLVYDRSDKRLVRAANMGKEIFQKARDEAHRFAVAYHRTLRRSRFLPKK